jgi:uncharacterized protein (DUF983 family)
METIKNMLNDNFTIVWLVLIVLSNIFCALTMHNSNLFNLKLWMRILLMIPPVAIIVTLVIFKVEAIKYLLQNFVTYFKK